MWNYVILDDKSDSQEDLELLIQVLDSTNEFKLIKRYKDVARLKKDITHLKTNLDIIFLKAFFSEKCGITIAKSLRKLSPTSQIVFISKKRDYAVEAYELGAIDYILLPLNKTRIYKTIERLRYFKHKYAIDTKKTCTVCCFKNLHFMSSDNEIIPVKWRTTKTKELFALLIHHRSETLVRKDVLIDLLWPEESVDRAYENLYSTIYQIRRTLKSINVNIEIISKQNGYAVHLNDIKCDVDEWLDGIQNIPIITDENLESALELTRQYRDDYLVDESYIWAENEQERLRILYQTFSNKILQYLYNKESYITGILLALKNQKMNPYLVDSYFYLMKTYDKLGDIYNVERQYLKLVNMYKSEFNTVPPRFVIDWYKNWIEKQVIF